MSRTAPSGPGLDVGAVVIGAGVIGLAVARELARAGVDVLVMERHAQIGAENSTHNSQVIHSGLYYPPGSLKARTCTAGRDALYSLARRVSIPHRRTGKLVVAVEPDEADRLSFLLRRGVANGLEGLEVWDGDRVAREEPAVRAAGALFVPVTGIVDAAAYLAYLRQDAEAHGAALALRTAVRDFESSGSVWRVEGIDAAGESVSLRAELVVNAAGLGALPLWARHVPARSPLPLHLFPVRGHYMRILHPDRIRTSRLIYPFPLPHLTGLGIHLTWSTAGEARLGPDTEWLDRWDDPPLFRVDPSRRDACWQAAHRYLPTLAREDLVPDMAGIRPKLSGPGEPEADFVLAPDPAGFGAIHLLGIESPGLTASLALAREVRERLGV